MTTIYHIQSTKPRSETGARPESVFFAWFVVEKKRGDKKVGRLFLSQSKEVRKCYSQNGLGWAEDIAFFRGCVALALTTYGTEPCAVIRKKIARLGRVCAQEAPDLPTLLDNAGFSFSVLEL